MAIDIPPDFTHMQQISRPAIPSIVSPNHDEHGFTWVGNPVAENILPIDTRLPVSGTIASIFRPETLPIFPADPKEFNYADLETEEKRFIIEDMIGFWLTVQTMNNRELFHKLEIDALIDLIRFLQLPVDTRTIFTQKGLEDLITELNRINGKPAENSVRRKFKGSQLSEKDGQMLMNFNESGLGIDLSYIATQTRNSFVIFDSTANDSLAFIVLPPAGRFASDFRNDDIIFANYLFEDINGSKMLPMEVFLDTRNANQVKGKKWDVFFYRANVLVLYYYTDGSYALGYARYLPVSPRHDPTINFPRAASKSSNRNIGQATQNQRADRIHSYR